MHGGADFAPRHYARERDRTEQAEQQHCDASDDQYRVRFRTFHPIKLLLLLTLFCNRRASAGKGYAIRALSLIRD
jgi:hypothetical protein